MPALQRALKVVDVGAEIVPVKSSAEGVALLQFGKADAFASDRVVLAGIKLAHPGDELEIMSSDFSFEPYALVLRRDDPDFRLAVNRALVATYKSGDIDAVYVKWLAPLGRPGPLLNAMFYLTRFPTDGCLQVHVGVQPGDGTRLRANRLGARGTGAEGLRQLRRRPEDRGRQRSPAVDAAGGSGQRFLGLRCGPHRAAGKPDDVFDWSRIHQQGDGHRRRGRWRGVRAEAERIPAAAVGRHRQDGAAVRRRA